MSPLDGGEGEGVRGFVTLIPVGVGEGKGVGAL